MIVADTSALVSLASINRLDLLLAEFDVRTTETVFSELQEMADYADSHGRAAQAVLDRQETLAVHEVDEPIESGRIDAGEGSAVVLARERNADFLITDDLRALPELQAVTETRIAISPILLRALVERDVLDGEDALAAVEQLADERDWLGAPIYRRAKELFGG
ncbi:conserved hypothetical protein [Halorhabdus utahensis DSM 12940]|uniref:Uncharacterized protein n=1 Tax=Halorhabdus utahensis (strain DSM 12940 / JCM 11049 / AX-2) TaxID=519442 RepID=C7NVK9_HALUD|nr:hypothetical protein [Halorhabdus utahensis]ACV12532.1 conserved hypothetical protein [Halorhabdus utahensis DSM 12940]